MVNSRIPGSVSPVPLTMAHSPAPTTTASSALQFDRGNAKHLLDATTILSNVVGESLFVSPRDDQKIQFRRFTNVHGPLTDATLQYKGHGDYTRVRLNLGKVAIEQGDIATGFPSLSIDGYLAPNGYPCSTEKLTLPSAGEAAISWWGSITFADAQFSVIATLLDLARFAPHNLNGESGIEAVKTFFAPLGFMESISVAKQNHDVTKFEFAKRSMTGMATMNAIATRYANQFTGVYHLYQVETTIPSE